MFVPFSGTSTAELNEAEKGIVGGGGVGDDKDASSHSEKSAINKYLNDGKVGRVRTLFDYVLYF